MQCWALSDIPTFPGVFPCSALFANIDHLLWRAKEHGVPKESLKPFSWILWFIWKGRSNFLFNGVDSTPLDTLHLPLAEARSWKVAQVITAIEEGNPQEGGAEETSSVLPSDMMRLRCQVDASWTHEERTTGLGFVLDKGDRTILMGLRKCSEITSPLQAE